MLDLVKKKARCAVGTSTASLRVSVGVHGGHTGIFSVDLGGAPLPHDPDGKVTLGSAAALVGKAAVVTTVVNKVAGNPKFTVVRLIEGGAVQCVSTIDGQFQNGTTAVVTEQVDFVSA